MSREVEFMGVVKRLYLKDKYGNWMYGEYVNEDYCCHCNQEINGTNKFILLRRIDMTCKECKYYKETYPNKGYCRLWKEYMKEYESCEDWEEEYEQRKIKQRH